MNQPDVIPGEPLPPLIRQQGVLVVDDSAVQRMVAVSILREAGVSKIYEAADGAAALHMMRSLFVPPAVIVLDLEMPGMDGIEFVQQLAQEGLRPALLVASSASSGILSSVETMIETIGLPLLDVVTKPLSPLLVARAMQRFRGLERAEPAWRSNADGELSVEALREALEAGRVRPYYQPKMRLSDGEVDSFEALARLVQEDGKVLPPSCFVERAEQSGQIDALTLAMLDGVLADLQRWHEQGFYPRIAINVSPQSLIDRQFANRIIARVDAARISPSALVIEITESSLVSDLAAALGTLGRLRLKGYSLSIDDYGTGFSSMQQLSRLPFTELKVDRAFVHNAHEKWNLRAILQSAIDMGHRLGLTTVAEGVETPEELQLLKTMGCHYAQGYLIAKPMPFDAVGDWMAWGRAPLAALCQVKEMPS
ncbi:MAG: EAL domain-containing response regulator [Rhodocyclaceae bacterium]